MPGKLVYQKSTTARHCLQAALFKGLLVNTFLHHVFDISLVDEVFLSLAGHSNRKAQKPSHENMQKNDSYLGSAETAFETPTIFDV